jgi:hypothetical protein
MSEQSSGEERQDKPTIEEIEDQIPEERKKMSFGGDGEDIIDVMDQSEKDAHHRGRHVDEKHPTCPLCPDTSNEHVAREVVAKNNRERLQEAKQKHEQAKRGE